MKWANLLGFVLTPIGCNADHSDCESPSNGMRAAAAGAIATGGMAAGGTAMGGMLTAGAGGKVGTVQVGTVGTIAGFAGTNSLIEVGTEVGTGGTSVGVLGAAGEGGTGNAAGMPVAASEGGTGDAAGMPAAAGGATRPARPLTYYESAPGFCAVFRGERMRVLEWISNTWQFSANTYSCYATGNPVHMIGATSVTEQPIDGTWANGTAICKKCQQANGSLIQGITVDD
jgi:hypothetical protein